MDHCEELFAQGMGFKIKNGSVLFYKNLWLSFSTWFAHLNLRFLYILGCSGPWCGRPNSWLSPLGDRARLGQVLTWEVITLVTVSTLALLSFSRAVGIGGARGQSIPLDYYLSPHTHTPCELGFTRTFPRNRDVTVKSKSDLTFKNI